MESLLTVTGSNYFRVFLHPVTFAPQKLTHIFSILYIIGVTQLLDDTILTAEGDYSVNFSELEKTFCLSLYYNGSSSYLFDNGVKMYHFKAKSSDLFAHPSCLANISKDFTVRNVKETRLNRNVFELTISIYLLIVLNIFINI